jgi:hypothetical protein
MNYWFNNFFFSISSKMLIFLNILHIHVTIHIFYECLIIKKLCDTEKDYNSLIWTSQHLKIEGGETSRYPGDFTSISIKII